MIRVYSLVLLLIFASCGTNTGKKVYKITVDRFQNSKILWDLEALSNPPAFSWIDSTSSVRSLVYESVPFEGKPTQVFAYYSNPDLLQGKKTENIFPAVVLVHGGGGKAFKEWVEKWAADGYAAIAMDLGGKDGTGKPLLMAGPDQTHENKFTRIEKGDLKNVWSYHAVASVILAHSFLLERTEVDAERTCLTGISWGGYLTCMVAGLDDRFKAAVPVYGCGYYDESDAFGKPLSELTPVYEKQWMKYFDPSAYLPFAKPALLFMNGNKDYFYNIVPYYKTYHLPKNCDKNICLKPNMKHGHREGWQPVEIRYFFESVVNQGVPLPKIEKVKLTQTSVSAGFKSFAGLRSARFYYSSDTISTNAKRVWFNVAATIDAEKKMISCDLPDMDFKYAFFYVTENRELSVSSPIFVRQ
ncbi:alpha/beta hydrolase family protein [Thermophagus sp. OGC60D27]|uniref:alpha/beta hydrolase family protein n=1 Tax=Thermophagus sp. OGC60D27 TaxID=3458415 RepID=UPI0040377E08